MVINEQQLFDYITCPALYDVKYNKHINIEEPVSMTRLLNKVSRYFYLSLLNGKVPTPANLKNKWDSICGQNPTFIDAKKSIEGMSLIMCLLKWASSEQLMVADSDSTYRLFFKAENESIELVGSIGTILHLPNNKYELLITDFSNKLPHQNLIDMKLKYSLDNYAFYNVYNKRTEGTRIRNIKWDKNFYTSRNDDDYERLRKAITNVGTCIKNNLYYPRESIMCDTCTAKNYCKAWS